MTKHKDFNFKQLENMLARAIQLAYEETRSKNSGEQFYALALCSYDDMNHFFINMNSEKSLKKHIKNNKITKEIAKLEAKWRPPEWKYQHVGDSYFEEINDFIPEWYDKVSEEAYTELKESVYECLVNSLATVRQQGFFDKKSSQNTGITLFVSIYDADHQEEMEDASAKKLNPKTIYKQFKNRYTKVTNSTLDKISILKASAGTDKNVQITYWIEQLAHTISGKETEVTKAGFDEGIIFMFLEELGKESVPPLLGFLEQIITKEDNSTDQLRFSILDFIKRIRSDSVAVHQKLKHVFALSCDFNQNKKIWHTTPYHIASVLHEFWQYPKPKMAGNNALEMYQTYLSDL